MSALSKAALAALKTGGKIAHGDRTLVLYRHDPDADNGYVRLATITGAFFVANRYSQSEQRPYTKIQIAEQPGVTAQELASLTMIEFEGQRYAVDDAAAPVNEGRVWIFRCTKESSNAPAE